MFRLFITTLIVVFSVGANGQISYDYVQVGYQHASIDTGLAGVDDIDGDGAAFGGSVSVADSFFLFVDYGFLNLDFNVDVGTLALGGGYHTRGDVQFVAKVASLLVTVDAGLVDETDNGYGIELGGRGRFNEDFEWEANVVHVDGGGDVSGQTGVNGVLRYHFANNFSTDLFVTAGDDQTTFGINFRLNLK